MQVIVRNLEKVTFSLNETKCDILNKTFWTYCLTVIFFLTSEERHILVCFTSLLYWPFLFPVRLFLTPLTLICIRFDSKYKHSRGRLRCRTPLVFKRKPLQREMGYRIRKRRELGESQAREETVESTLCRHSRYRSVVPPPYPTQSCSTAKCEGREREGGEGVPHCRYESKWWRQEQRRIIAVAHRATLHGQNSRTSHTARSERESEGGNQRQPISCDCTFPLYCCCYYYYFISIAGILSVAFRRGNSTTSQSVLRLRI